VHFETKIRCDGNGLSLLRGPAAGLASLLPYDEASAHLDSRDDAVPMDSGSPRQARQ
jgi:hypothetical protein